MVEYREALEALGVDPTSLKIESDPASDSTSRGGVLAAMRSLLAGDREARRQYRELRARLLSPHIDPAQAREILILLRQLCRERQWLLRYLEPVPGHGISPLGRKPRRKLCRFCEYFDKVGRQSFRPSLENEWFGTSSR